MDDVTRLIAIEDLRVLKARYWRYVDTRQWKSLLPLFAEDATFVAGNTFDKSGREQVVDGIEDNLAGVSTVHRGYQHELEIVDETTASGIWVMTDYLIYSHPGPEPGVRAADKVHGYGHYVDRYVKVDGHWRFKAIELHRLRVEVASYSSTKLPEALLR